MKKMQTPQYLYECPNQRNNLYKMRLNSELCDVIIQVNEKSIHAHKVVLAAGLSYFHSMFVHSFREKNQDLIPIKDVDEANIEDLISFAYTGKILLTKQNALSLLEDANYLNEIGIKEACIKFLENHLSPEDAGWAFRLARAIDSPSLEKVARQKIISHFDIFSQTNDFFKLDLELLKFFLTDDRLHSVNLQKILFEAIMKWILYDAENRRIYVCELLDFIKATNVRADYVMDFLCEVITDNDYKYIEKSVLSFYRSKTINKIGLRTGRFGKTLIIANRSGTDIEVQLYDFIKSKWSETHHIANELEYSEAISAIFEDQFYFYKFAPSSIQTGAQLEIIDLKTKKSKVLSEKIPRMCTVCACAENVYLCGGFENPSVGNNVYSNQIFEYNPHTKFLESLSPMKTKRFHAASIYYEGFLYVLGGCNERGEMNSVEKYNFDTQEWSDVAQMCEPRWNFEVAVLNGRLYACGGTDKCSVEVYNDLENKWNVVADMNKKRWDFTVVPLEGKLLAIGGDDEVTVEVYHIDRDEWLIDHDLSFGLKIQKPTGGLIPSSCISNKKTQPSHQSVSIRNNNKDTV